MFDADKDASYNKSFEMSHQLPNRNNRLIFYPPKISAIVPQFHEPILIHIGHEFGRFFFSNNMLVLLLLESFSRFHNSENVQKSSWGTVIKIYAAINGGEKEFGVSVGNKHKSRSEKVERRRKIKVFNEAGWQKESSEP